MSEKTQVLLEAFGSIKDEDHRISINDEPMDYDTVIAEGINHLNELGVLNEVDEIVTGMDAETTYAVEDAIEAQDIDVEVDAFYPDVTSIQEEDDLDYQTAWQQGFNWRNGVCFADNSDEDRGDQPVKMAVRLGDAGNSGMKMLEDATRKSVSTLNVNLDQYVDLDSAYGSESDAPEEVEA